MKELDEIIVLDGGTATVMESLGLKIQTDPLWTARAIIADERVVIETYKRYIEAGAKIITTPTYQAVISSLVSDHRSPTIQTVADAESVIRRAIELARQAISESSQERKGQENVLIAGSIGPYACKLADGSEYHGNYIQQSGCENVSYLTDEILAQAIRDYYRSQISAMLGASRSSSHSNCVVDILAIETVPSFGEVKLICEVVEKSFVKEDSASFTLPIWISVSCKDGVSLRHGDKFADVVDFLCRKSFVTWIGINCCNPEFITPLLSTTDSSRKPFVIYPNSGETWDTDTGFHGDTKASEALLSADVPKWIALNARIIGGCCQIGPSSIAHISSVVQKCRRNNQTTAAQN